MYATRSSQIGLAFRTRPTAPTQACVWDRDATKCKSTQYGSNCRESERGGKPPAELLRSTVRNDAQTSASVPGHATCQQDPIPAPTRVVEIGRKLTPFRVLRPAQKQGTNQKTRKRPPTERGGGRAAMGTSVRDGAPRRLTPAPAQSAVQTAFLFATVECAAPLLLRRLSAGVCRACCLIRARETTVKSMHDHPSERRAASAPTKSRYAQNCSLFPKGNRSPASPAHLKKTTHTFFSDTPATG